MSGKAKSKYAFIISYLLILTIATIAAYSDIFQHEMLRWDDSIYLNSKLVNSLEMDNLISIASSEHHRNWHPLTTLSFAIEHAIWGINAPYSKLVNLVLHLFNVLLFFYLSYHILLLATDKKRPINEPGIIPLLLENKEKFALYSSLMAATLFSLHPQHVESVAWISERKGLLCAFFYLSTLITYIKVAGEQKRLFSNLTLIFMLCALMSKPVAVSLPIALMLLDVYPLRKVKKLNFSADTLKTLLQGKLIYLLVTAVTVVITLLIQEPQNSEVVGYGSRLVNAAAAYLHYLTSIFYPQNLSPFYPFPEFSIKPSINSVYPCLAFSGLVLTVLVLYKRGIHFPLIIFSFYVITLLPMIGIVKVGFQAMADRYAYLPTIWIYLLMGVVIFALFVRLSRTSLQYIVPILFVTISISLWTTTFKHTRHWQNDIQLWERAIEVYPDSASFAYTNLAAAHDAKDDMDRVQIGQLISKALSISPNDPYVLTAAANYQGMLGEEQKALEHILRIVTVAPYNTWALARAGDIYFSRNDIVNAEKYYLAALTNGVDAEEVAYRLAIIDYNYRRYTDALSKLEFLTATQMGDKEKILVKKINEALSESSTLNQ
jgi:tetratricopeptide (TPR) repeat protein